jgi:inhibitor of cysteine peptidase
LHPSTAPGIVQAVALKLFYSNMKRLIFIALFIGLLLFFGSLGVASVFVYKEITDGSDTLVEGVPTGGSESLDSIDTFASAEEFREYIDRSDELTPDSSRGIGGGELSTPLSEVGTSNDVATEESAPSPERYSETNVQVGGIDEPDIVKTDGETIYFSKEEYWVMETPVDDVIIEEDGTSTDSSPEYNNSSTRVLDAFPLEELRELTTIDTTGEMLLTNDTLLILNYNSISAYDVSNPSSPIRLWTFEINDSTSIVSSRLYQESLYVVTQQYTDYSTPCPVEPLLREGSPVVTIRCLDIYHPTSPIETDSTYSVLKIEPDSGQVTDSTSFIGSAGSSLVYMSPKNIYVTYTYQGDYFNILTDFFLENDDLLTSSVTDKIRRLKTYDISTDAKLVELMSIIEQFQMGLDEDERTQLQNEFQDRMTTYMNEHGRELMLTGIAKIDEKTLEYEALGTVPGYPLNQFALDEYNNNLRIATTVGNNWGWGWGSTESTNDVYVLDDEMKVVGSITDLGLTESIYSVRFIGDAGYVVTFLQTDPLYVLDLTNPHSPRLEGELEIPGYSSYLHPISDTLILGVGQEDWNVKLSLFDVSNPNLPQEVSTYNLDEGWTEVSNNHHAFMIDSEHKVFFLPGSTSGYIFSYEGGQITLVKAVSDIQARRALYIDDYLYIIGDDKVVVLDESSWERVKELELSSTN